VISYGAATGNGPTLIDHLVGIAIQRTGYAGVLDTLETADPASVDFQQVADLVGSSARPARPMQETLQFERASFMDSLQRIYHTDPTTGARELDIQELSRFASMVTDGGDDADLAALVDKFSATSYEQTMAVANDYYDRMTQASMLPYSQGREILAGVERDIENETNPMVKTFMPALSRYYTLVTGSEVQQRGTQLAARIKAFEQQNGSLPESLDVFGEADFTVDPFTGARFRYERTDGGFRIYSVGPNGVDDGGVHDRRFSSSDFVVFPPVRER
jgi:hypothetical protein